VEGTQEAERVNVPLKISFKFVDQFGKAASGIKVSVLWSPVVGVKGIDGSLVYTSDPKASQKTSLIADQKGMVIYEGKERCPGGFILIDDKNFICDHVHFGFALTRSHPIKVVNALAFDQYMVA